MVESIAERDKGKRTVYSRKKGEPERKRILNPRQGRSLVGGGELNKQGYVLCGKLCGGKTAQGHDRVKKGGNRKVTYRRTTAGNRWEVRNLRINKRMGYV